jgi:TP901 family phage tail tape measure protein
MQLKEEAVFTLKFDGKPVINQLSELEQRLLDVKQAQKDTEKGTKEWAENKTLIKELEASIKQVREEMGVSGMTVQQLRGYYRQLASEIDKLTPGTDAYIKKAAEMQEVNTVLAKHREDTRAVNVEIGKQPTLWERAKNAATEFMAGFGAVEVIQRAFSFVQGGIKNALELEDAMSGVAKATGQSRDEVLGLSEDLDKIDTRSTKESLMDIAQIGGQLGVANTELLGFVKSVDMANVALGDEFSGGAEEVSSKLGGLQKLFKETKDLQAGEAINQIGSAINELGAAGSATGPVIAEFTSRMGQLGDLSPQISQTMGLGAAFQELGLSAEISAGGLSNILLTAAKDTATFAQQIGVSDAEMKKLINTNPNEFLLRLAESLKNVPADQLATRLYDLGIKSQEATKVMSLMKDQTDMVREKQELASKAMAEGTSLQKEFNTVNENAAAQYEKSQKALALIATEVGQALLPAITLGTRGIVTFVNIIRAIPEFVSENRTSFAALGVAVLSFNSSLIVATATSIAHAAQEKARLVWTNSATAAQWLLNTAMTANPIALVVTAVALLVAGFTALYNNSTTLRGVIGGTWEVIKTGVVLIGDLTEKVVGWIQKGLEPLRPALETVSGWLKTTWGLVKEGVEWLGDLTTAAGQFVSGGLSRISTALEPVRTALNNFWSLIDTGITKIKSIGSTISNFLHVDEIVGKVKSAAGLIGDAFNRGYTDKLNEDQPKQLASHQQGLDKKKTAETKAAGEMADIVTASDQKALDKKAAQAEKHRDAEAKKAAEAAKKEADEKVKADADALKKVAEMQVAAIKDDLERDKAKLQLKHDNEVAAIATSKASQSVQAVWVKALNEQLARDIDKAETDHRTKHEKEEAETAKRVLDLKIKLSGDEKADKLQKLEDVATAQRAQVVKDVTDQTERARLFKQINDNLTRDTEQVNAEFRRREQEANNTLRETEHSAKLAALNRDELEAGSNAQRLLQIKKTRLDTEYDHFRMRLRQERDDEMERIAQSNMSQEQKTAAQKAINDRYLADVKSVIIQHTNETNQIDQEDTERRRARRQSFFSAIKAMMDGDFTAFTDILAKKQAAEGKQLSESQKKQIETIDEIGGYAVMATQALMKLSQLKLDKEIANINKEKTSQLASWKEKYDKGLINKDEYEKGVERINKEADTKTKQAQLDAFRRQQKLDIAMAVINGAQAALKSLATLGWPLGLFAVAGAAVTTGIQIAMIKAQQPPSLARGGMVQNGGVPDGPRHGSRYGESGLSITRRDTGQEVAEMEGGEPIMVLSRNTYANNGQVIDRLLHSSLHRNGAPIYRNGGLFGEGGSYRDAGPGNYLKAYRKGGVMFADGGWMDQINDGDVGGGSSDGNSGGGDSGSTDTGGYSGDSASSIDANTQAQIEKSQATMEAIVKNTLATATGIDKINLTLTAMQTQQRTDSDSLVQALGTQLSNLRSEIKTSLTGMQFASALGMGQLMLLIDTKLTALQNASRVDSQVQGTEIQQELVALRNSLMLGLGIMNLGNNLNASTLAKTTQTGFDTLGKLMHTDLTALGTLVHTDLSEFQLSSHDDAQLLIDTLERELSLLDTNVATNLNSMTLANALQALVQRQDNAKNFTTLQDILRDQLERLRDATHSDLGNLAQSNKTELQSVQDILVSSRNEQGAQTGLLGQIAAKDLSVQTFVNVFNQIDVIANKSDFK